MEQQYKLTQSDYEQINKIIKITSSIDTLYKKLYDLETNNQKDCNEYQTILGYLDISLEVEKNYYDHINYNKFKSIINYLLEERMPCDPKSDMEAIILQDDFNRVIRRIISILNSKILNNNNELQKIVPNELLEMFQFLGFPITEELILKSIKNSVIMRQALKKETLNKFLVFLKDASEDMKYVTFRNELLKAKYDIVFVNKEIETEMLISNFNVMNFIFDSEITADRLKIDDDLYNILKSEYGVEVSTHQLLQLLELSDIDYNNEKNMIVSILRQAYMRSGFLLLEDNELSDINYVFHELIEESEYLKEHKEDKISTSLIIQSFKNIEEDRKKYNISSSIAEKRFLI